ncbi:MAG: hypothetical protein MRECE_12c031 [Mycoplasmataceae bacterium CE_OT135]|nr:MAG: hypothetical protein MRECE_12c031 [Mycoplasmataceae bacterium CE_OT135]
MDRQEYWKSYYQSNQEKIKRARKLRYKQTEKRKRISEQLIKWKEKLCLRQEARKFGWAVSEKDLAPIREKIEKLEEILNKMS